MSKIFHEKECLEIIFQTISDSKANVKFSLMGMVELLFVAELNMERLFLLCYIQLLMN